MKTPIALGILAVLLSACAAQDTRVARADCKVAPVTTRSAVNKAGPVSELDRKWAEAQLRSSDYRRHELLARGPASNLEEALDDCR